jgi:hypothetical protein
LVPEIVTNENALTAIRRTTRMALMIGNRRLRPPDAVAGGAP